MRNLLVLSVLITASAFAQGSSLILGWGSVLQGPQVNFQLQPGGSGGPYNIYFSRFGFYQADLGQTGNYYEQSKWFDFENVIPYGSYSVVFVTFFSPYCPGCGQIATQQVIVQITNTAGRPLITSPYFAGLPYTPTWTWNATRNLTFTSPNWPVSVFIGTTGPGSADLIAGDNNSPNGAGLLLGTAGSQSQSASYNLPNVDLWITIGANNGTTIATTYYHLLPDPGTVWPPTNSPVQAFEGTAGNPFTGPDVVVNGFTGTNMILDTADAPAPYIEMATSQQTSIVSVYPGDSYSKAIRYAAANSPVYMSASPSTPDGNLVSPGNFWCLPGGDPTQTATLNQQGYCYVGNTDSTGYFAIGGNFNGQEGNLIQNPANNYFNWSEQWWVGGLSQEQLIGIVDYAVARPNVALPFVLDPIKVTLSDGSVRTYRRTGVLKHAEVSAQHFPIKNGFRYEFDVDATDARVIRVGHDFDYAGEPGSRVGMQNGWMGSGFGWAALDDSPHQKHMKFSLDSDWLPGPVAVMFAGEPTTLGIVPLSTADNMKLAHATDLIADSTKRLVIGPAIPPDCSNEELVLRIKDFITDLNLGILIPLTKPGIDLKAEIEKLKPATDFEKDTIACLKAVIQ